MKYQIPLFDLNFDRKEEHAVVEVLRSRWISTGPITVSFENKFAEMMKINHAIALSSCTASLHLALLLASIRPRDEVFIIYICCYSKFYPLHECNTNICRCYKLPKSNY